MLEDSKKYLPPYTLSSTFLTLSKHSLFLPGLEKRERKRRKVKVGRRCQVNTDESMGKYRDSSDY